MNKNKDLFLANSNLIRRQASLRVNLNEPTHIFMRDMLIEAKLALEVSRISVWTLETTNEKICLKCVANTDWANSDVPKVLPELAKSDYPSYFSAIEFGDSILAHEAELDVRTIEFSESYLKPQNIKSMLDTIIFENGFPLGVVCCEHRNTIRKWSRDEVQFAELIADCCTYRFMAKKQAEMEAQLKELVYLDDLTKTHNRRYFFESIHSITSYHIRASLPLSIALLDLDDFKRINDTLGHDVGDKVLKLFASVTKAKLRAEDILCRFGGEEFMIILQNQTLAQAKIAIERIQSQISISPLAHNGKTLSFTCSAGIAQVSLDENIDISVKRADLALYEAKRLGKNRVICDGQV